MRLYHSTPKENIPSILKKGLMPNRIGIVYLTPSPDKWKPDGEVCLIVETGDLKLTAFEDCRDWEVLCWGHIKPENIKLVRNKKEVKKMKVWEKRQAKKGYLTWQEYMEAVEEDRKGIIST